MNNVLSFIKAHTLALACAVVALIAIGVLLFYIPGQIASVKAEVDKDTKEPLDQLTKLVSQPRTLPQTDINGGEPQPLPFFPTRGVVEQGKDAIKRLHDQADASLAELATVNKRTPLVENELPNTSPVARQSFYDQYRAVTLQTGQGAENSIIHTVLHGALPPTDAELKAIGDARANEIYTAQLQRDATGKPVNQQTVDAAVAAMRGKLEMEQRIGRALSSKIYVSPDAVAIHPFFVTPNPQMQMLTPETVFNAQVSLWLQQTAFEAIDDANKNAKNVFDAPVKHLVKLNVPMEVAPVGANATAGGFGFGAPAAPTGEGATPATLTPDPTAVITPNYTQSPYGYFHNSLYDAIPISMDLRVDVRQLPQILSSFGHNRLLKVNNVNLRTVDYGAALAQKYIYDQTGKTPMVEVHLDCDVILLRTWLAPLMPQDVKNYFSGLSNPTPAGA